MSDFFTVQQTMVKTQLVPENVMNPRLLNAFLAIPREKFVPFQLAHIAYMDADFPLKKGRFLLRPATLGRLLEALNPQPSDKVLYVAIGTGYGSAILSQMVHHVVALDSEETFTQEAERLSDELKLKSLNVILGSLCKGWENAAPYDKIFIEGCVDFIPKILMAQLQEEGQLVTIKSQTGQAKVAVKIVKKSTFFTEESLFDAFAPRLEAFRKQEAFIF